MAGRTVELTVAGESCRVVTTAAEEELQRFAAIVEDKLGEVLPQGRPVTTKAVILAAVALAHDLEEQRARADAIASRARTGLHTLLHRVDDALAASAQHAREREARQRAGASPRSRSAGESPRSPDGGAEDDTDG